MLISFGNWEHSKKWILKVTALNRMINSTAVRVHYLWLFHSFIYLSVEYAALFVLLLITILKTINCFLTSVGLFTKKYVQRRNKDPKHIRRAGQSWARGHQALLCTTSDQTYRPGPSASKPRWFLLAGSHPEQQHHQRQHLACTTGTLRGLQSLCGLQPDLQSQEICGWKGRGKKLCVETEAVGANPPFSSLA